MNKIKKILKAIFDGIVESRMRQASMALAYNNYIIVKDENGDSVIQKIDPTKPDRITDPFRFSSFY